MKIVHRCFPLFLFLMSVQVTFGGGISYHSDSVMTFDTIPTPTDGGIRMIVPAKFRAKFEKWKSEITSTQVGRAQWEQYEKNKNFILTIVVTDKRGEGAGTDGYLWDDEGRFVGATITLGSKLDRGFPDPIYYPVMNSLKWSDNNFDVSGSILAATKIIHELGHVNQTATANRQTLETQNSLMPEYISIFLKNGRNTRDEKLVALAQKMGGTPVEIWESREYWSEVAALSYLKERISGEAYYCPVFNKIQYNIEQYAKQYEDRFDTISHARPCKK